MLGTQCRLQSRMWASGIGRGAPARAGCGRSPPPGPLAMVSTRTTAQSQREVQRLDCSVPGLWLSWLLVFHIVRPLGVALTSTILEAAGLEGAGRRRGWRWRMSTRTTTWPTCSPRPSVSIQTFTAMRNRMMAFHHIPRWGGVVAPSLSSLARKYLGWLGEELLGGGWQAALR